MVEEADALKKILAAAKPLETVEVPLLDATNRFLVQPLRSSLPHPRFDNSVVDGYALRSQDGLAQRRIIGEQPAGRDRGLHLENGEAIRIFTGAPIPSGADAVVMQEDVKVKDGLLTLVEAVEPAENIRREGADLARGQLIGQPGDKITPQIIGLLASQGISTVLVPRMPRVTVLGTGNELRSPGSKLEAGEIYDANSLMLAALLQQLGIAAQIRHSEDDPARMESEISRALAEDDVLIISGGVSVGDHDYVKLALAAVGITLDLWRIRMKPGKPLAFAQTGGKLIFGLPGNPVASFVTFLVLVRPALLQMLGARGLNRFLEEREVPLAANLANDADRPHYLRGQIKEGMFHCQGLQESHALHGLSQSTALLRMNANESAPAGAIRRVLIW